MLSDRSLGEFVDVHYCFADFFCCIISLLAGPSAGVVSTNVTSSCVHQGPLVCVITVALPHLFI